jgi:hypothetical protein
MFKIQNYKLYFNFFLVIKQIIIKMYNNNFINKTNGQTLKKVNDLNLKSAKESTNETTDRSLRSSPNLPARYSILDSPRARRR